MHSIQYKKRFFIKCCICLVMEGRCFKCKALGIIIILTMFILIHIFGSNQNAISVLRNQYPSYNLPVLTFPGRMYYEQPHHVVCTLYSGRLGNLMFEFASSYGIARSKGMKLVIGDTNELINVFNISVQFEESGDCEGNNVIKRFERHCCSFDERLLDFNNSNDVKLGLYLQSYYYFNRYSNELRKQFTFKKHIRKKSKELLNTIFTKNNLTSRKDITLIGVHVRRGDYVNNQHGKSPVTKKYLQKAVDWFKSRYTNIHFIVASDGIKWTKKNMPNKISVSYLEGNSPEIDMATITSCDHMISTVGTFSWWSAWLVRGQVTYYKWPAMKGTPYRKHFNKDFSDYFYPHWVGL